MKSNLLEYPYYRWPEECLPKDRCTGNNAKRMLVLANSTDIPEHLGFLKKILRAVGYDFETDVRFATLESSEEFRLLNTQLIKEQDTLLAFGVAPTQIGLQVHGSRRILQFDKLTVLLSPALHILASDEQQKRSLWSMLKQHFQI